MYGSGKADLIGPLRHKFCNFVAKRTFKHSDMCRKNCVLSHAVADQPLLVRQCPSLSHDLTHYTQEIFSPKRGDGTNLTF